MGNAAIDWNSLPTRFPQFDTDQPPTKLELLTQEGCESATDDFVDWMRAPEQREELYCLLVDRLGEDDMKRLAKAWAASE